MEPIHNTLPARQHRPARPRGIVEPITPAEALADLAHGLLNTPTSKYTEALEDAALLVAELADSGKLPDLPTLLLATEDAVKRRDLIGFTAAACRLYAADVLGVDFANVERTAGTPSAYRRALLAIAKACKPKAAPRRRKARAA